MANEMTVYGAVPNATELITTMGNAIHNSGLLGCDNAAQGIVLAMTCFAKGSDPMSLAQRYHIIKGRLSMRADAMLAEFRNRGGKHKVVTRTGDEAVVSLTMDGDTQEFSFCWTEAQCEPFVYNGKESEVLRFIAVGNQDELAKRLKPKYATPRARMQMLWARVVSDGVRAMCPEVNLGTYTPEEIDDFDETQASSAAVAGEGEQRETAPPSTSPVEPIEDADFTPVDADAGKITGKQLARITELFKAMDIGPEKQLAAAKKRGAESIATLTTEQADDLLNALETRYRSILDQQTEPSVNAGETTEERIDAAVGQAKIEQIKSLLTQIVQTEGNHDFGDRFKAKLAEKNLKLSQLTEHSADQLIRTLSVKNLDEFFKLDLKAAAAKNG